MIVILERPETKERRLELAREIVSTVIQAMKKGPIEMRVRDPELRREVKKEFERRTQ